MISPRADFRNNPQLAKGWQTLMDSVQFQKAVYAAKLEMDLQNRSSGVDLGSAAAMHYRNAGALQFLSILMNLTATEATPKKPTGAQLNHDLK